MRAFFQASILVCGVVWNVVAVAQSKSAVTDNTTAASAPTSSVALAPLAESLRGEAKAEYAAARILYDDGDFTGALTKLTKAHRLSADPRLLWNMAAAEKNLRHYSRVIDNVERFLAAGAPYVSDEDRTQAQELLAAVKGFVSEVTFDVQPVGVEVEIDGQSMGTTPLQRPLSVDFGHREVRLSKLGYRPELRKLELEGGKPVEVAAILSEDLHQGALKIVTDPQSRIRVDGKIVGVGMWQAQVPSGSHTIQIEGDNKVSQTSEVVILDGESRSMNVLLNDVVEDKHRGVPTWVWIAGGVAVAGLGTGAYFLFREDAQHPPIQKGTWQTLEF